MRGGLIGGKIQEEDKEVMDAQITENEILEVINTLEVDKAPGIDGLNAEYYKMFKHLGPKSYGII